MNNQQPLMLQAGIAQIAYGIKATNKEGDPFAFDAYDNWFGEDFDFLMDSWLEDTLALIESDITSVDSTNLSEARSEQMSAQSSADRAAQIAAGITPSESTSRKSSQCSGAGCEDTYVSTPSSTDSGDGLAGESSSPTETEETTLSHEHSDNHGGYYETTESFYSGQSWSDDEGTGFSNSSGTSQATGEASTLDTVSFDAEEYADMYEDNDDDASIRIIGADEFQDYRALTSDDEGIYIDDAQNSSRFEIGNIGGV